MTDDPTKLRNALTAANRLIDRMQERVADHLAKKGADLDEAKAFYDLVEMLETAHEIDEVRMALDDEPTRFGEPSPFSAGNHTG
jgi:hypothetical protein